MRKGTHQPPERQLQMLLLASLAVLALFLRLLGAEEVFRGPDVVFRGFDSYYHARRILYSTVNFPAVLERDAYLNFPQGSAVPWPPLYDFLLATVARGLGGGQEWVERVAALAPPVLGALCVVPAWLQGSLLGGPGVGLLAATFTAVLDAHVHFGRVGAADHHAMTAFLGGWLLWASMWVMARRDEPGAIKRWALLVGLRVAVVLTWPGSVMILAVTEAALLLGAIFEPEPGPRTAWLRAGTWSTAITAGVLLFPALASASTADYGMSPSYFTTFHPLLFAVLAALHGTVLVGQRLLRRPGPLARLGLCVGVGALVALVLLAMSPSLRQGMDYGLRFLSGTHAAGNRVLEEQPLFARMGSFDATLPHSFFGYAVYLLPLVPLAFLGCLRNPRLRPAAGLFLGWFLFFGGLSLTAIRFTNELSAAAPTGLALLALVSWGRVADSRNRSRSRRVAAGALAVLVLLLLAPTLEVHRSRARGSLAVLRGANPPESLELGMFHFAQQVRMATPETRGYLDPTQAPRYGIFAWSGLGHILHYVARRPTPADNFGPVIGLDDRSFLLSTELFRFRRPRRVVTELDRLGTPWVVSTGFDWGPPDSFGNRLHRDDASEAQGRPALARFRLVLESEPVPSVGTRFKLFELVEGARIEFTARAGSTLVARLPLRTNTGRRFVWTHRARADPKGKVRLRVPYATLSSHSPTRALGLLELQLGDETHETAISESQIRSGSVVQLP